MTKSEMRACRRGVINEALHNNHFYGCYVTSMMIRTRERSAYGSELPAYGFPLRAYRGHVFTIGGRVVYTGGLKGCEEVKKNLEDSYQENESGQ